MAVDIEHIAPVDAPSALDGHEAQQLVAAIPALVDVLIEAGSPRVYGDIARVVSLAILRRALAISGGNQLRAARLLGINRNTFRKYCRDLDPVGARPARRVPRYGTPRLPRVSSATAT